jgi:hypothetical protein
MNYLPGLALNHDPPDLSLPSNLNYQHESQASGSVLLVLGHTGIEFRPQAC